jgi:sugar phosphate isomerase/epimerase
MAMKAALNAITIKNAPLLEKIRAAGEAGYGGIGLWADELQKFRAENGSLERVKAALQAARLEVVEICAIGGWMWAAPEAREKKFASCEETFRLAQEVGSPVVIACASEGEGSPAQAVEDYAVVCDLASDYGVTPALEFIGPFRMVKDVATAWAIVREANRPNAALLVDTFHYYRGSSRLEDLAQVPGGKVALVHINDVVDLPREQLNDGHRVLPGEGVLNLDDILGVLERQGYQGYLSLELFNEELWGRPAAEVARRGRESLRKWTG